MNKARLTRLMIFILSFFYLLVISFFVDGVLWKLSPFSEALYAKPNLILLGIVLSSFGQFFSLIIVLYFISIVFVYWFGKTHIEKNYDETRRFLGNDWLIYLFNALRDENLFLAGKSSFTFISPAANRGIYEKHLYEYIKKESMFAKFLVADHEEIKGHIWGDDVGLRYICREPMSIGEYISEINEKYVDAIFDIKGSLWNSLRDGGKKVELLEKFYSVLNNRGFIVVDNSKRSFLAFAIFYLFGQASWFAGESTGRLLNKNLKRDREFGSYYYSHFEQHELTFINDFGKPFDILVLKKK